MQTATQESAGKRRRPVGRQDADKQEAVMKPKELSERMEQLVALKKSADEAAQDFNEAIKAAAEISGFLAATVRKLVVAKAGEDLEAEHRKVEQLSLAFDECA